MQVRDTGELCTILQLSCKSEIILKLKGYFKLFRKKRVFVTGSQTFFRVVSFKMEIPFCDWSYFSADKIITNDNHNDSHY